MHLLPGFYYTPTNGILVFNQGLLQNINLKATSSIWIQYDTVYNIIPICFATPV